MSDELSRRTALAAAVGGVAALAGCSVEIGDDAAIADERLRQLATTRPLTAPHRFPLRISDSMFATHRDRAQTLLESVPTSPDVPNQLVADRIAGQREQLSERLGGTGGATPAASEDDESADSEPPDRQLSELRQLREEAAYLHGSHRAATGDITAVDVHQRRDRLRDRLAEFRTAWDHRGTGPLAAVRTNVEIEHLVESVRHELEPWPLFPSSPEADVDQVGYLVRKLEAGAAALDDAEQFRNQQPTDGSGYQPAMMATATWLRRRARREAGSVERYRDSGRSAFDRDLGESVASHLFDTAYASIRRYTNSELIELTDTERYAGAVRFAGTRRAAVTTFAGVVSDVEGGWDAEVSVTAIEQRRKRAREAVQSTIEGESDGSPGDLLDPGYGALRDGVEALDRGNGVEALAQFEYARRFATVTADVTDEVAFLLRSAAQN